ncbi:RNA polymerase sigma factor [Streptomyces sp. NPDC058735]|uniref:RNA polymerase sigma factor n=1 Tax=unclassified Streptomyces TaxID=2593676 RepID=UPI0036BE9D13
MLQAVRGGSGPSHAVRAYLLTSMRRVAASWTRSARREQLVDDFAVFAAESTRGFDDDTLELGADVRAMHEAEQAMAMRAFRSLPERLQAVLWHTEVEDESPSEVATLLGLDANGTRVLAGRGREGLKQAYLQAHVRATLTGDEACARYADQPGTYVRGGCAPVPSGGCASTWRSARGAGWPRCRSKRWPAASRPPCRSPSSADSVPPGTPGDRDQRRGRGSGRAVRHGRWLVR